MTGNKYESGFMVSRIDKYILVIIAVMVLLTIISFLFIDANVYKRLRDQPINLEQDTLIRAFVYFGKAWALIWWLLVWILLTNRLRPVLVGLFALVLLLPVVHPLKILTGRPRPREVAATTAMEQENVRIRGYSFPSGDTASAFAVAASLAGFVRWPWAIALFTGSSGIGLMRVAQMAHYPSDVFCGAAIGVLCGRIALRIGRRWDLPQPACGGFGWCRIVALLGVIVIPVLAGFFLGSDQLLLFLKTHVVLAVAVLLLGLLCFWSQRTEQSREHSTRIEPRA